MVILRFMCIAAIAAAACFSSASGQSLVLNRDFRLGSPYSEPDGRNDVVKISTTDFITLAKVKRNQTGNADFVLERFNENLQSIWQVTLKVEPFEDYKDIFYNGKELILLSVVHNESEKKTRMEAYGFDIRAGNKLWKNELESFEVGNWETHAHKGKVKESFIDVVVEHTNKSFVTPFLYKHNIYFSPDESKFISYVYNYGEKNLTATVTIYDNACKQISRDKVSISNDFVNHGIYLDNSGMIYLMNVNKIGKVEMVQYNPRTKESRTLSLPATTCHKDDFHVHFHNNLVYIANSETKMEQILGVRYTILNFNTKKIEGDINEQFSEDFKQKISLARKANKLIRTEEDWLDYDISNFLVESDGRVFIILEKRTLFAEGRARIKREDFDQSHVVDMLGHVRAQGIMILAFDEEGDNLWQEYLPKSQLYPANDGLKTISFTLDNSSKNHFRILFASSDNMEGMVNNINLLVIDKLSGKRINSFILPNDEKLTLVRDYTLWLEDNSIVIVGKKGLLGKTSEIAKYKF